MKKLFMMAVVALATVVAVNAQDKTFEFGLKAGVNMSQFDVEDASNLDISNRTSFYGGALLEMHMTRVWSLQGEVLYGDAGSKVKIGNEEVKYSTPMIDIPLALKLYLIENKLSLHAGVSLGVMIDAKGEYAGRDIAVTGNGTDYFDLGVIGGAEFKFGRHFFIDARYKYGFSDIQPDAKLRTIQVGLGYRF
ncbi:MAG: porin family protein [Bacteroidales bacterium]